MTTSAGETPSRPVDPVLRWLVVATLACIAGCALLLALGGSDIVTATGIVLGGIAFVLVLAAAFYAVGRSEDRERAEREGRPGT
jgi:ABC-type transport system involved in cytochrome bd biosynthesis fused ATPase/permease subunit